MSLVTPYSRPDQFARRSIKCRSFTSRRASSSGRRFARPPHEHNTDGYERHPDDLMGVNSMSSRKVEQHPVPAIWTECNDGSAEEDRDSSCNTGHDWRTLDARPSTPLVPRLQGHRRPGASHVWNPAGLVKRTMAGSRGGPSAACRPFPLPR